MELCCRNFSHSDGKGNFTRQSGKRHSLSPSIDHLSLDVVDHVPGKVPESSFPVRLYIFEVLRERFNVDSSISFRSCAYLRTVGRHVDKRCVHDHSVEVSDAVVRHSSTI